MIGDGGNSSQPTDTEGPKVDIIVGTKTENSIEITVNATDESGIATYEYYLNSEETPRATSTSNSYTYTGLTGGESYTIKVVVTDNVGNSTTATKVEKTNAVPGAPTVTFNSKTTNSITVQANATDADGGSLTYTLYTSTSSSEGYEEKATATGSSGNNVSLTASGLSQYTTYYYYVTVTDQISNNQSITASQRTYCPGTGHTGTYCSGGTTSPATCYKCGGRGIVCRECGQGVRVEYDPYNPSYPNYKCDNPSCPNSGYASVGITTCSVCNGSGQYGTQIINCSHGYSSSHYYCTAHNYVGSVSNHCVHGKTAQHDN